MNGVIQSFIDKWKDGSIDVYKLYRDAKHLADFEIALELFIDEIIRRREK